MGGQPASSAPPTTSPGPTPRLGVLFPGKPRGYFGQNEKALVARCHGLVAVATMQASRLSWRSRRPTANGGTRFARYGVPPGSERQRSHGLVRVGDERSESLKTTVGVTFEQYEPASRCPHQWRVVRHQRPRQAECRVQKNREGTLDPGASQLRLCCGDRAGLGRIHGWQAPAEPSQRR